MNTSGHKDEAASTPAHLDIQPLLELAALGGSPPLDRISELVDLAGGPQQGELVRP